jgi:uncharacterized protein YbjQ (UPF0145 family)
MAYQPGSSAGLPAGATERLRRMRGEGPKPAFFTSDLSVDEFVLVRRAGFFPLGLVMGSCIYHVGFQWQNWNTSQELTVLTQAMYGARELAMTRMEEEADLLGADGVVGVRLEFKNYAFEENVLEFQALGTAVRHESGERYRTNDNRPFTSDLSGQDFWKLIEVGYRPVTLAMGACVYHIRHMGLMQSLKTMGRNTELQVYSEATYTARELALERMQAEAQERGGSGIVGVRVEESTWGWGANAIEFFAIGTSVVEVDRPPEQLPQTVMTVGLNA